MYLKGTQHWGRVQLIGNNDAKVVPVSPSHSINNHHDASHLMSNSSDVKQAPYDKDLTPYACLSKPQFENSHKQGPIDPYRIIHMDLKGLQYVNEGTLMPFTLPSSQIFYHNSVAKIERIQPDQSSLDAVINTEHTSGQLNVQKHKHLLTSNPDDATFSTFGESSIRSQNPRESTLHWHSALNLQPLETCLQPNINNHEIDSCSARILPSEEASKSEDSKQSNLEKKRKNGAENVDQKHCNCKNSGCLKRYCVCFAGGKVCDESCNCEGCSNKSSCEKIISSAKQNIKKRNAHAFSPEVIHANGEPIENSNERVTSSSARHKTGCSCKNSKCQKKYCVCYKAGVGCMLGCRCNGCENIYGTKEAAYDNLHRIAMERIEPNEVALMTGSSTGNPGGVQTNSNADNAEQLHSTVTQTALHQPLWFGSLPDLVSSSSDRVDTAMRVIQSHVSSTNSVRVIQSHVSSTNSVTNPPLPSPTAAAPRTSSTEFNVTEVGGTSLAVEQDEFSEVMYYMDNLYGQIAKSLDLFQSGDCLDSRGDYMDALPAVKTGSPNKKRVCPPQILSPSVRKFPRLPDEGNNNLNEDGIGDLSEDKKGV